VRHDAGTTVHIGTFAPLTGNATLFTTPDLLSRYSSAWTEAPSGAIAAGYSAAGSILLQQRATGLQSTLTGACTFVTACWGVQWPPDSRHLYTHRQGVLWDYEVGTGVGRQLYTGTKEIVEFIVSPVGMSIAFPEDGSVKVLPISGGAVRTVFAPFFELNVFR